MMKDSARVALAVFSVMLMALVPVSARDRDGGSETDEINMSVDLDLNATVTINDISGPVTVETTDGNTAQIHVERSAPTREELEHKKILVEHTSSSLNIHTEPHNGRWERAHVKQTVVVKLPRQVNLHINDVAGAVQVGDIEGDTSINDVAGSVRAGRLSGSPHINDVAGAVMLTVEQLGANGIRINDIAGRVELTLGASMDADVDVSDVSGSIDVSSANVSVVGKVDPEHFHGKLGNGGPEIRINDIAGGVTLKN